MALMPEDWINHIDREAKRALNLGTSRYDLEWGRWSADMNRHLTMRIKEGDPETPRLKIVFYYWVLMSQAIEFAHKKRANLKINENRFLSVISSLEEIKQGINSGCWPDIPIDVIEKMVTGDRNENSRFVP